jgi:hypothetical protein
MHAEPKLAPRDRGGAFNGLLSSRRPRRLTACALALLGSLAYTAPLSAAPSASERETARGLMEDGDRLSAAGDVHAAMVRYASAHAIMHVPTTGVALANTQAKLGMLVEARATAIEVLNLPATPGDPAVFATAKESAGNLANQLEPRVPSVRVTVAPADAVYTVTIDAVTLPNEARAVPYRCNPGSHTLRVEAPGYATRTLPFELNEGQAFAASLTLQPLAHVAESVSPAAAAATSAPGLASTAADIGEDPAAPGRLRGIIGLSVGGAALIAGSVAGIVSASKTSSLKSDCPNDACGPRQRSALSSSNTLANVANIAIPVGLIGVGYGLFELFNLPSAPAPRARAGNLHVAVTGAGALIGGSL